MMKTHLGSTIRSLRKEIAYRTRRPRRLLFDHLPKCAGTTITAYLLLHYPRRHVFTTNGQRPHNLLVREFRSLSQTSRYHYHLVHGHLANELMDYVHPDTLALTVFREPIDRIISHYFYVKRDRRHYLHQQVVRSNIQLADYVSSGLSGELRNWYTTHFTGLSIEDAESCPDESVNAAFRVIADKYDVIGFQDDVPAAIRKLGTLARLHRPFENRVLNRTDDRVSVEQASETVRQTIGEVNFLDVRLHALLKARLG